jgi:hypothetical protein
MSCFEGMEEKFAPDLMVALPEQFVRLAKDDGKEVSVYGAVF